MRAWIAPNELAVEPYFSKSLRGRVETLNNRIRELQQQLAAEERKAEFEAADVSEVNFKEILSPPRKVDQALLLQAALRLRGEVAEVLQQMSEDRGGAIDKAERHIGKLEAKVKEDLLAIGYVEAPLSEHVAGKIQPGWIAAHPRVHAARNELMSLRSKQNDTAINQQNQQAMVRLRAELERIRDRAAVLA